MAEYDVGEYQRLEIRQYPARTLRETAEGKYWRRFKSPSIVKQVGVLMCCAWCAMQGLVPQDTCKATGKAWCQQHGIMSASTSLQMLACPRPDMHRMETGARSLVPSHI